MYEHLRTWTHEPYTDGRVTFRLDLWDTGRTRDGKSELRYHCESLSLWGYELDPEE